MAFLSDGDLISRVFAKGQKRLVDGVRDDGSRDKDSPIQACSVDLTVGEIFLPGEKENVASPLDHLSLMQGQTAVIKTQESLNVPRDLGAIAFPPSSLSIQGLLMTNPGHVDPGYSGNMHFTVINMSREAISLKKGDKIVTVLFFALSQPAAVPYNIRDRRSGLSTGPVTPALLGHLSQDFLDVTARANKAAGAVLGSFDAFQKIWVPIASAAIAAVATIYVANQSIKKDLDTELAEIQKHVGEVDNKLGISDMSGKLDSLSTRVQKLEDEQPHKP